MLLIDTHLTWDKYDSEFVPNIVDAIASTNDAIDYDYLLYKVPFGSNLYIVKDSKQVENRTCYLLWRLYTWKYESSPLMNSSNKFDITVSSITKKEQIWTGDYELRYEPCIPEGYYEINNNGVIEKIPVTEGHHLVPNTEQDILDSISKDKNETIQRSTTISGTVLSAETGKPIQDCDMVVALVDYNNFKNIIDNSWNKFPDNLTNTANYAVYTDVNRTNGEFTLNSNGNEFVGIIVGVKNSIQDKGKYLKTFRGFLRSVDSSVKDFRDLSLYVFDDSFSRKMSDKNYNPKYNTTKELTFCDYIKCYNTSAPVMKDTINKYRIFSINSTLPAVEKRKIKVIAEFRNENDKYISLPSSCLPELFLSNHDVQNDTKILYGWLSNITPDLNFDSENLRNFTLTIKDFGEGNDADRFESSVEIPEFVYQRYNIYVYAYYKIQPSVYKKIYLNDSRLKVEEGS